VLHITNGENAAAVIRAAVPGEVVPWNDVLHEGPVPADVSFNQLRAIRARFIADCGWQPFEAALRQFADRDRALEAGLRHDEVVLWFEHDLYDQLQLLQLLDWFATCELGATRLTLICDAEYVGTAGPPRAAERFPARAEVTHAQLALARSAWAAFRAPDPTAIESFIATDTRALRFVAAALTRHLEQFPSVENGLSRTEQQIVEVLLEGPAAPRAVFARSHHEREDPVFLGDTTFARHLQGLSDGDHPLVLATGGARVGTAGEHAFWTKPVTLTDFGRDVAGGRADHVRANGIDRWFGGVQLSGADARWRWSRATRRLVARALS
jgi:hypothetical protein